MLSFVSTPERLRLLTPWQLVKLAEASGIEDARGIAVSMARLARMLEAGENTPVCKPPDRSAPVI